MKLRTQFLVLVGGIIAVPFVVSAFMIFVQYAMERRREPLPNYNEIMSWVTKEVPRAIRRHDLDSLGSSRPPELDVIVLDKDLKVESSTVADLAVGAPAG
ncbi:MAG TPA: hypothetical protein VHE79_16080, partial [Spirochaetia bacterium]